MAFGKITKEDLIAAGLDPDKLATFQANGVTKADLEALKTEMATSLTNTVSDLIKTQFAELETKLKPTPVNKGNEGGEGGDDKPDEQTEFLTDPVNFVKRQTAGVATAAAIEFKKMSREMAWREGSRILKGMANDVLKKEIEEEWKKYPPEVMAKYNTDPVTCLQQIHDMVLGKHHEEIMHDTNKKEGKFNLVHSGTSSGVVNPSSSSSTGGDGNKAELSDAEKVIARKFGMTDEEWKKQGEDMEQEEISRRGNVLAGAGR